MPTDSPIEIGLSEILGRLTSNSAKSTDRASVNELRLALEDVGVSSSSMLRASVLDSPHELVKAVWGAPRIQDCSNSLRGNIFERLVELIWLARGLFPFYTQATLAMVPNVRFDLVLFPESGLDSETLSVTGPTPICISLKTSLRERYKQAELEAAAARDVYRWSRCYLITLDAPAAKNVAQKIAHREVASLEAVLLADTPEFDAFLDDLSTQSYIHAMQIPAIVSSAAMIEIRS